MTTLRGPGVKSVGKPDAGNRHVRFDERGREPGLLAPRPSSTLPEHTGEERQPDVQLQDVLFSPLVTSVCYWTTIFLLAIVGAYLIQWWLTHPGTYAAPANDPWGITTPPWLILPLAPIGVVGSLGHAAWCALRGQRTWKMLITAASLVAVMGCSKLLEIYLAPM